MASGEDSPRRGIPRPLSGGPTKFGPYWLDARLAVGGTAEVYVARPIDPQVQPRRVIVKRLLPHFLSDPEGLTMFEREAALHAAVHSSNVVEVYASGRHDGEPWLAMELVDGRDLYRLLRRLAGDSTKLRHTVAVRVAREVLRALESVHTARDERNQPLGIVHRDVTPSNVYLSNEGRVKLGDFGIARSSNRHTMRSGGAAMLKGKFAYLAPEQIAGESFDHRADLFSAAVVMAEMFIGRPLFAGSGQLAVLLAIRDCRIDSLREIAASLPAGLFEVLERALSREPSARWQTAAQFSEALAPFEGAEAASTTELANLVRWVQSKPSTDALAAVRESAGEIRAAVALRDAAAASDPVEEVESQRTTGEYTPIPSHVVTQGGSRFGPWTFARLVEGIATGEVRRGDMVDFMGQGLSAIEAIANLERFLPASTATTSRLGVVGVPEFVDDVSTTSLLTVLLRVVASGSRGVLFAEGPTESRRSKRGEPLEGGRKDLYFVSGRLHHVSSNNASELLGEFLVRRKVITRDELDFALAVLPRYAGRMGDTLISLGLVPSLDIFAAIRDQGRDRLVDLFTWRSGRLTFYADQTAPHVEFPLELDLLPLLFAGVEAAMPGEAPIEAWRYRLDTIVSPGSGAAERVRSAPWPPVAMRLLEIVSGPLRVRDALAAAAQGTTITANDVLRALEILLAAGLLTLK